MSNFTGHIKYCLLILVIGVLQSVAVQAQNTIAYDISTSTDYKRVFLFNTQLRADSAPIFNKAGRKLSEEEAFAMDNPHADYRFVTLFESDGSALLLDTGGNLFLQNVEDFEAKPKPLHINIDTLGVKTENVIIETSSNDLENLKLFVIPYSKYKVSNGEPAVKTQMSLRLEEIIYGAKGKVPPRLLDMWREQIKFIPENRKILYDFTLVLPESMVYREGTITMMIYDLSYQVVAIFPDLQKAVNVIRRDNILTNTYVYKIFFNEEEVKKGLIHFLSPEDEKKKQEELNQQNKPKPETPPSGESE